MSEDVLIGRSNFTGRSSGLGASKWFYLKDNVDNVYRVLPPIKSLASAGKYSQWHASHRVRNSEGYQKSFSCKEERTKEGLITRHCPFCDRAKELEGQLEAAEKAGATREQLQAFRTKEIFPIKVEKSYYLNVVNQEGNLGVLGIKKTSFDSLKALAVDQEKKGRDITGMEGIFLNFKKVTPFKGSKDVIYQVEVFLTPMPDGSFRFVPHTITPEVVERIKTDSADLTTLFKDLSVEQISTLIALEGEARGRQVDVFFNSPEKSSQASSGLQSRIPGTSGVAVTHVQPTATGFELNSPKVPANFHTEAPNNQGQFQGKQNVADFGQSLVPASPQVLPGAKPTLSDEDFFALVKPK